MLITHCRLSAIIHPVLITPQNALLLFDSAKKVLYVPPHMHPRNSLEDRTFHRTKCRDKHHFLKRISNPFLWNTPIES